MTALAYCDLLCYNIKNNDRQENVVNVLPNNLIRKSLGIRRDVPVYYIGREVGEKASEQIGFNDIESKFDEMIDKRPFDEVVLIMDIDGRYIISHILENGDYRSFMYIDGEIHNHTIRENFNFANIDMERDQKLMIANKWSLIHCLSPFCIKKNVIVLASGKTIPTGKKGKSKKQKYITVGSNIYTGNTIGNSDKDRVFPVTSVAGHPMYYKKNPLTNGHDRKGNDVIGWTWRSPYKTGEGKEILEKIRMWK